MAVSKSNNVDNIAPSCHSAVLMQRVGRNMRAQNLKTDACTEFKNRCAHPHVQLGHGSKGMAHVRVDTSQQAVSTSFNTLIEFKATEYSIRIRNFEDIRLE